MKMLVIGLGSMGKRRIRLLQQIDADSQIIGVDGKTERRVEAERLYHILTCDSIEAALKEGCEAAFVCTSPLSHGEIIETCLQNQLHVFTEINLVQDKYATNMALAKENHLTLFLSSTFLYRDEIAYIRREVQKAKSKLSYNYHVGQYLPDWHPWENYKEYFVGDKRTNGCREIMAIDFPWIYKTFGAFQSVQVKCGKKSGLNVDYPDSYLLLVEHDSGVQGMIAIDVISRKAVRNLEIYGEDLYLTWNGSADGLRKYNVERREEQKISLYQAVDRQEGYASFVVENAYKNEIMAFLSQVNRQSEPEYDFTDDKIILQLIDEIEGKK